MSKLETPMIREYWTSVGGTLIEEFPAVLRSESCARRLVDAVIIPKGEHLIARASSVDLRNQDIVVVQAKAKRLGMYLMGQALFSAELLRPFQPASIRSIALCVEDDSVLRELLRPFPHVEVFVMPQFRVRRARASKLLLRTDR